MSWNALHIIGNVGQDPRSVESRTGRDGAGFSLAWNKSRMVGNEWVSDPPVWYNVTVWGSHADYVMEKVKKGMRVLVTGKLEPKEYINREGEKKMGLNINNAFVVVQPLGSDVPAAVPAGISPKPVTPVVHPARPSSVPDVQPQRPYTGDPVPQAYQNINRSRRPRPVGDQPASGSIETTSAAPAPPPKPSLVFDDAEPKPDPSFTIFEDDSNW